MKIFKGQTYFIKNILLTSFKCALFMNLNALLMHANTAFVDADLMSRLACEKLNYCWHCAASFVLFFSFPRMYIFVYVIDNLSFFLLDRESLIRFCNISSTFRLLAKLFQVVTVPKNRQWKQLKSIFKHSRYVLV